MFASLSFHLVPLWQAPCTAVGRVGGSAEGWAGASQRGGVGDGSRCSCLSLLSPDVTRGGTSLSFTLLQTPRLLMDEPSSFRSVQ